MSEATPMCGSKPVDGGVSGRLGVLSGIWWYLGDPGEALCAGCPEGTGLLLPTGRCGLGLDRTLSLSS